jgi:citrate synthase
MLHDPYGDFTPSDPMPPVPCRENSSCTESNRICERHKFVLFVKILENGERIPRRTIEIPYGKWENWDWYIARIAEVLGIGSDSFRVIFVGGTRTGPGRHSGLQYQSTVHCVIKHEQAEVDKNDEK